jgi:hypothetical protein
MMHYFELLQGLHRLYPNLPPEHMWNMNKKGIQMGESARITEYSSIISKAPRENTFIEYSLIIWS